MRRVDEGIVHYFRELYHSRREQSYALEVQACKTL